MQKATAIIFIKKNSERIPRKNFKLFNGRPLYSIILEKLNRHELIDNVLVDSDSEEVLDFVSSLSKGIPVPRPGYLCGEHIAANELLQHDLQFAGGEHIFQTHVTNPLLTERTITESLKKYFTLLSKHDSLFSVTRIQKRVFFKDGSPINHQKNKLLRTQDLDPVFEENSSFFIFSKRSFSESDNSRIGLTPFLYEISSIEAVDIDYENEFKLAELLELSKNSFPEIFGQEK
jgi:CMP-N-acetylneuraminic acid synthetase